MAIKLKTSTIPANYPTPFTGSHQGIILIPSTENLTSVLNSFITGITQSANDLGTPLYKLLWIYNEGPENLSDVSLNIVSQNPQGATTTLQYFNDNGIVTTNPSTTISATYPGDTTEGWDSSAFVGNLPAGYAAGVWTKTVGNADIAVSEDFITLATSSQIQ
jgi:hypothetical protein